MLNVQRYLLSKTLRDLKREHGVDFKVADYKVILNYNQIEARSGDRIAEECRGLILRKADKSSIDESRPLGETKILNFAFRRFYNHGDPACAKIDWDSAIVQEKADGTLCMLYFDDVKDEWHVSTRKVPEADLPINGHDMTFRQLFEKALFETSGLSFQEFAAELEKGVTYAFELCTPFNRVQVHHDNYKLYFLLVRELKGNLEMPLEWMSLDVPPVKTHPFSSIDDLVSFVNSRSSLEAEGVVIVDKNFNRIKIKSLEYTTRARLQDVYGNSPKNCLTLILSGKDDDVYPHVPGPIQELLNSLKVKVKDFIILHEEKFAEGMQFAGEDDPKLFADWASREAAMDRRLWTAPLFSWYRKQSSSMIDFLERARQKGEFRGNHLKTILEKIQ